MHAERLREKIKRKISLVRFITRGQFFPCCSLLFFFVPYKNTHSFLVPSILPRRSISDHIPWVPLCGCGFSVGLDSNSWAESKRRETGPSPRLHACLGGLCAKSGRPIVVHPFRSLTTSSRKQEWETKCLGSSRNLGRRRRRRRGMTNRSRKTWSWTGAGLRRNGRVS